MPTKSETKVRSLKWTEGVKLVDMCDKLDDRWMTDDQKSYVIALFSFYKFWVVDAMFWVF